MATPDLRKQGLSLNTQTPREMSQPLRPAESDKRRSAPDMEQAEHVSQNSFHSALNRRRRILSRSR